MKRVFSICMGMCLILACAVVVKAKAYESKNQICVMERNGNDLVFLDESELFDNLDLVKAQDTRDQFQWFFTDGEKIQAKVYRKLRDAIIQSPEELYQYELVACAQTAENEQLAHQVGYKYALKDDVCVCVRENGKIECAINDARMGQEPYEQWVLFFETQYYPHVINGLVPRVLAKAWGEIPDDQMQGMSPCGYSNIGEEFIKGHKALIKNQGY